MTRPTQVKLALCQLAVCADKQKNLNAAVQAIKVWHTYGIFPYR